MAAEALSISVLFIFFALWLRKSFRISYALTEVYDSSMVSTGKWYRVLRPLQKVCTFFELHLLFCVAWFYTTDTSVEGFHSSMMEVILSQGSAGCRHK